MKRFPLGVDTGSHSRLKFKYRRNEHFNGVYWVQILLPDPHAENLYHRLAELGVCEPIRQNGKTGGIPLANACPTVGHGSGFGFVWQPFDGGCCYSRGFGHYGKETPRYNRKCKACALVLKLIQRGVLRTLAAGVAHLEIYNHPTTYPSNRDTTLSVAESIWKLARQFLKDLRFVGRYNDVSVDRSADNARVVTFGHGGRNQCVTLGERWHYIVKGLSLDKISSKAKGFPLRFHDPRSVTVNHRALGCVWLAYNYRKKSLEERRGFLIRQDDKSWRYEEDIEGKRARRQEIQVDNLSELVGL